MIFIFRMFFLLLFQKRIFDRTKNLLFFLEVISRIVNEFIQNQMKLRITLVGVVLHAVSDTLAKNQQFLVLLVQRYITYAVRWIPFE